MSRFNAQIRGLEKELARKASLAAKLEAENRHLSEREGALLVNVATLEGSASALASCSGAATELATASPEAAAASPAAAAAGPAPAVAVPGGTRPGTSSHQWVPADAVDADPAAGRGAAAPTWHHTPTPAAASPTASCSTGDSAHTPSPSPAAAAAGAGEVTPGEPASSLSRRGSGSLSSVGGDGADTLQLLEQQMQCMQQLVHAAIAEMGPAHSQAARSYAGLRTTRQLTRLAAAPATAASYLAMDTPARVAWLVGAVRRLGLLLPKAELMPRFAAELEEVVDEVVARGLMYAWFEPDCRCLVEAHSVNMETGQHEPFPDRWWHQVVQSTALSQQQKTALRNIWQRIQASRQHLMQQHATIMRRLGNMQARQAANVRRFEREAAQMEVPTPARLRRPLEQDTGDTAAAAAAPAAAAAAVTSAQPQQQQQQQQQQQTPQVHHQAASRPGGLSELLRLQVPLEREPSAGLLLPVGGSKQRKLEAEAGRRQEQMLLQEKMLYLQIYNICTTRQLAQQLVSAWPYVPCATAICEALDDLGW